MKCAVYYHPDFAEHGYPVLKHRVKPGFEAVQAMPGAGQIDFITPVAGEDTLRLLEAVHTGKHIQSVKHEGYHDVALLSAASVIQAAEDLAAGKYGFAFAFTGSAGHHAGRNYAWGFCYYNDAAMAVMRLREQGVRRIMIFDIDPHFGDGTRDILGPDPEVLHINFYANNESSWDDRQLNNYDCQLGYAEDHQFEKAVDRYVSMDWDFEFLMVVFGHDGHTNDYGGFRLFTDAYVDFARKIKKMAAGRPLLYILSGGSRPEIAAEVIPAVIQVHL